MTFRSSLTRTATIALAIAALAAPTASARPADMPPAVAKAAAAQHKQYVRSVDTIDYPTRPVLDQPSAPANSRPDNTPQAPADPGTNWATIAIGIAGGLLAVGRDRRHRKPHAPHRARTHHRLTDTALGCRPPHRHPRARKPVATHFPKCGFDDVNSPTELSSRTSLRTGSHFGSPAAASSRALDHPALVAAEHEQLIGVLTYIVEGSQCEVLTLHVDEPDRGVGTALIVEVKDSTGCGEQDATGLFRQCVLRP